MRRPGLNHPHIARLQDPFDTTTHIHKPQIPLQHVQRSPSTGAQRVFPLQRPRNRALCKLQGCADGNEAGRKYYLCHYNTSIIFNTFIINGDPSCHGSIIPAAAHGSANEVPRSPW